MGKIVYHGTLSDAPPHDWLQDTFHAGTKKAAFDRLDDEIEHGVDWDEVGVGIGRVHAYEISDTAPMSRREWSDPDVVVEEGHSPNVPEHKENRIYPYKNLREDYGSTSYVIPSGFVGRHVKHLGVQFQGFHGTPEQENALMHAITSMSGGRVK